MLKSNQFFTFTSISPEDVQRQYVRRELERVVKFLQDQIVELQAALETTTVDDTASLQTTVSLLAERVGVLESQMAPLSVLDFTAFLTEPDLAPIIIKKSFTGNKTVAIDELCIIADGFEVEGTLTIDGQATVV